MTLALEEGLLVHSNPQFESILLLNYNVLVPTGFVLVGQKIIISCAARWPPQYAPAPADVDF